MPTLISRWTQDVTALAPRTDRSVAADTGTDLLRRWSEPHRRYHSTQHLVEMFDALEDLIAAHEISEPEARLGRVAAWLHDAVYDPGAPPGANERASAALAGDVLRRLAFADSDRETVASLVEMTADHVASEDTALERAFHDVDLWILAADVDRFDEYCAQVRYEYAAVPDAVFGLARSQILRDLVGGTGLYFTAYGQEHWDEPARANLARELARLG